MSTDLVHVFIRTIIGNLFTTAGFHEFITVKVLPTQSESESDVAFWSGLTHWHPHNPLHLFRFRFCSNGSRSHSVDDTKSINIFRFRSVCFDPNM